MDACAIGIMEASDFVKAGDLKLLGELGYPPIAMGVSWMLGGPKGIPEENVEAILKSTIQCFNDPEFRDLLDKKVISVSDKFYGPDESRKYLESNGERVTNVLTDLGLAKKK